MPVKLLKKNGKLVKKGGKLVKTDNPANCPCCGAPPPPQLWCCDGGAEGYFCGERVNVPGIGEMIGDSLVADCISIKPVNDCSECGPPPTPSCDCPLPSVEVTANFPEIISVAPDAICDKFTGNATVGLFWNGSRYEGFGQFDYEWGSFISISAPECDRDTGLWHLSVEVLVGCRDYAGTSGTGSFAGQAAMSVSCGQTWTGSFTNGITGTITLKPGPRDNPLP